MKVPISKSMMGFAITLLLLVGTLASSPMLNAQSFYGSIVGTVTDSSGASIPGATVTVTNTGTNEAQKVQSDAGGKYNFVNLVPAAYKITVEKTSFKRFERLGIPVQVGATVRIDSMLAVGNVSETVEVTTQAPLLQTDSSTQGQEIEGAEVQEMPLNGRNVLNLIALAPNVVPTGASMGGPGLNQAGTRTAGGVGWGNYEIGGSIQGQGAQYIDGVPNNLLGGNVIALVPTQDAIQELNVVTSNAGADFGRFSGGVVNMTTRSGTNAFHGTVYEYIRNKDFNANDYFSNLNGSPRPVWNQNQYGVAVSGPIVKDKLFFMFTWEGFRALTGAVTPVNVPTLALQNGVFANAIGTNIGTTANPNYVDPLGNCTIAPYTGQTVNGQTFAPGGYYISNLYQGSCGDPMNEVIKQYYPLPNSTLSGANWYYVSPLGNQQNQYNGRVDYTLSDKQRLFARYTYWAPIDQAFSTFGDTGYKNGTSANGTKWPTKNGQAAYYTTQGVVGDTYAINPTTVLDVRLNYVRQYSPNLAENVNVDETQFGAAYAALASQMDIHEEPAFNAGGGNHTLFNMSNFQNTNTNWYNTYGVDANLTKIIGAHSLKVGTELRLMDQSSISPAGGSGDGSGKFTYNTANWMKDEWANFLLGYPSQAQFAEVSGVTAYMYYQAYYVTDNWQPMRNLTLNLGVRYELPGAVGEKNNKATVLLPNAVDPNTGITGTEALVASSLYGGRTVIQPKYDLFAPRVGFVYRAGANTVVRGGYGISYLPNDIENNIFPSHSYVNSATTTVNNANAVPMPLQTTLAGWVTTGLNKPTGQSNPAFMTNLASSTKYDAQIISGAVPFQNYPYAQQWNAALSHQFKGDLMVEVAYTGLSGTNIPGISGASGANGWVLDQIQDGSYTTSGNVASGPLAGLPLSTTFVVNPNATPTVQQQDAQANSIGCAAAPKLVTSSNFTVGQCIRPNPFYANVADAAEFNSVQHYRSVLVRAEKRMGTNGVLNANYTWSRSMGNTDTQAGYLENKPLSNGGNGDGAIQDFDNPGGEISLISFDVTNRAIVSYVQKLPFGRGQKYANSFGNGMNAVVSGWAINGITTFQSGFPVYLLAATGSQMTSNFGAGTQRPLMVPGCNPKIAGGGLSRVKAGGWFNTSCFENVGATTTIGGVAVTNSYLPAGWSAGYLFGNEPRVDPTLRADGIKNFDFSFQKSTPIHESANFEFRAEFFNIFNRVQFAPPVGTVGAANYGNVTYQANKPRQIQLSARINF